MHEERVCVFHCWLVRGHKQEKGRLWSPLQQRGYTRTSFKRILVCIIGHYCALLCSTKTNIGFREFGDTCMRKLSFIIFWNLFFFMLYALLMFLWLRNYSDDPDYELHMRESVCKDSSTCLVPQDLVSWGLWTLLFTVRVCVCHPWSDDCSRIDFMLQYSSSPLGGAVCLLPERNT